MVNLLSERISEIEREDEFEIQRMTEKDAREIVDSVFEVYRDRSTPENARRVYDSIEDQALVGRIALAKEYAERFEREVGYGKL